MATQKTVTVTEKSRGLTVVNIILYATMLIVALRYLILPLLSNDYDLNKYLQSQDIFSLALGFIVPGVVTLMINGKLKPKYEVNLRGPPPTPRREPTEECYCCAQQKPVSDLKTYKICSDCRINQGME